MSLPILGERAARRHTAYSQISFWPYHWTIFQLLTEKHCNWGGFYKRDWNNTALKEKSNDMQSTYQYLFVLPVFLHCREEEKTTPSILFKTSRNPPTPLSRQQLPDWETECLSPPCAFT